MAPSLEHQVAAMLSILARYNWQQFSVVTSEIAGHDDFVQAVRDRVAFMKREEIFRFVNGPEKEAVFYISLLDEAKGYTKLR